MSEKAESTARHTWHLPDAASGSPASRGYNMAGLNEANGATPNSLDVSPSHSQPLESAGDESQTTLDARERQWAWLSELADEWEDCVSSGRPFVLSKPSPAGINIQQLEEAVTSLSFMDEGDVVPAPVINPLPVLSNEAVWALLLSARNGDRSAHATLKHFHRRIVLNVDDDGNPITPPTVPSPRVPTADELAKEHEILKGFKSD
ncbi:hypothetical protein HYDPIDRAFT_23953 [Hydnomerulius pinastri MD-312]|nr:hypothetical protein HYDPIDRAFT_23953 [Hydnomerulius pinastri MD-312]